jgi:hypothetical protein
MNITENIIKTTKIIELSGYYILFSRYYYLLIGLMTILLTIFFIFYLNYDIISTSCNNIPIIRNIIKIVNYLYGCFNNKKISNNENNNISINEDQEYMNILNRIYVKISVNNYTIKEDPKDKQKKKDAIHFLYKIKNNNQYIKTNFVLHKIVKKLVKLNKKKDEINNLLINLLMEEF